MHGILFLVSKSLTFYQCITKLTHNTHKGEFSRTYKSDTLQHGFPFFLYYYHHHHQICCGYSIPPQKSICVWSHLSLFSLFLNPSKIANNSSESIHLSIAHNMINTLFKYHRILSHHDS